MSQCIIKEETSVLGKPVRNIITDIQVRYPRQGSTTMKVRQQIIDGVCEVWYNQLRTKVWFRKEIQNG